MLWKQIKDTLSFIRYIFLGKCKFVTILHRTPTIKDENMAIVHSDNNFIDYDQMRYVNTRYMMALMLSLQHSNEKSSVFKKLRDNSKILTFNEVESFNSICGVCIETMKDTNIVRVMNCDHAFHIDCIDQWFEKKCCCPYCNEVY